MIDAARIGAKETSAMDRDDLEIGMALKHAVEDEIVQRDRSLQWIADDVVEVEAREASRLGEAVGVNEHDGAEFLGPPPERRESGVGEFSAGDIGENLHALELELRHA